MKVGNKLVAFITGGASGLGAQTARRLHRLGAQVCIADLDELLMDQMKHDLGGSNILTVKCDVSEKSQVQSAVQQTVDQFGSLHAGIACAGIIKETRFATPDDEA